MEWFMVFGVWPYWALVSEPGFLDFQISRFWIIEILCVCKMFLENLVVRFRVKQNKGVLDRLWTKLMILSAIPST
jgi:hypothetical protein